MLSELHTARAVVLSLFATQFSFLCCKMQIRQLSSALRKKAEEELNETPSTITSSLKILRDWLKQQPHLHSVNPCKYQLVL
ncbi:Phosphatidylinositol transfer protein SEC14 [Operophtera brumata]|uniref:Phosphatidylinositol transfer protein SEC14 n=1 Tax=Operophtera brumata TaxID=104452 RepID=A0A0L7LBV8_OPEBR|nr:Phosphatidylinositol transfer protein SEC14 [Operophtera brumata]